MAAPSDSGHGQGLGFTAAHLAGLGLFPFPLRKPNPAEPNAFKRPASDGWQNQALNGTAKDHGRWAQARVNLGLHLGPSRLVVIDTDTPQAEAWAKANLPPTPWVTKTGKGFRHRFYRLLEGVDAPRNGKPMPGMDLKAAGGYVLAPGSWHFAAGLHYLPEGDWTAPLAALPHFAPWWIPEQKKPATEAPAVVPCPGASGRQGILERARKYTEGIPPAVSGQGGHAATYNAAVKLADGFDLAEAEVLGILSDFFNPRCFPPWTEEDLAHKAHDGWVQAQKSPRRGHLLASSHNRVGPSWEGPKAAPAPSVAEPLPPDPTHEPRHKGKVSQATLALMLAADAGAQTWLDDAGNPFVTVPVENHVEHYRLKPDPESPAGRWLAMLFYQSIGKALTTASKKDTLSNLMAEAMASRRTFRTGRRVERVGNQVFLDLCLPTWELVQVTPAGWEILPASGAPVRFTRAAAMLPLPRPVRGGTLEALRPFFNCGDDSFRLIIAWILAALSGGREYPILVFGGEAGSAKSTVTRYARALIDPNAAPLRKTPKEERDLFIAAMNSFVLTFDNLSNPPEWLPDCLCALALDTGYAVRALYTDTEETVFRVAAPIILNGISEQLTRSDLADRAFGVTLNRIGQEDMKPKDELDAAFRAALPGALGALLDVLSSALDRLPQVHLDRYPRLAQTAKLLAAAEPALGWEPGTFIQLFDHAQETVAATVTEGDSLAQALQELVSGSNGRWYFHGTSTELRALLETTTPHPMPKVWPPAVNALGTRLRRIGPQLRLIGWQVNPDGRDGSAKNGRVIQLCFPTPSSPSLFSSSQEKKELSELSDCPKASQAVPCVSDSSFFGLSEAVRTPGQSSDSSSDSFEPRTVHENPLSEREPAPMLVSGQSDSSDSKNINFAYVGEI